MSEMASGVSDPPLTEAKGGSDAARIAEVTTWLSSQFDAAGKDVPEFDYTPRSITHLYNLATISQAKSQAATIVANDFRQKASEYRAQAARIREILENVGLAQESLPSTVVSSAQVLANVANLLNIRDTELSSFLVAMADISLRKTGVAVKLNEILDMFEDLSLDDSAEHLKEIGDLGLSRLKIQENTETKVGEVPLDEWLGPSNAIEGYVPKRDRKSKASRAKYSKDESNSNHAKPSSREDFPINKMGFTSTIITSNEHGTSKNRSGLLEARPTKMLEEQKGKGICKDLEQQAVVSESPSAPCRKGSVRTSKDSRGEVKIIAEDEQTFEEAYDGSVMDNAQEENRFRSKKTGESSGTMLKPSLKSSGAKKLGRSVTWADEKTDCVGSAILCEVREMKNTRESPQAFGGVEKYVVDSMALLESAEACAIALSQAAEAVASGNSDVSDIVSEAGIIILPHPHDINDGEPVDDGEPAEDVDVLEPEPTSLKWPLKPGIPRSDVFDPEDSWFDAPPEDFSLILSTFATMWNALFGWITSSSLAYIYGKDESFHEDYLFVNGKEYPRKVVLGDGRSSEIKGTLAGCLGRALPGLVADLGLPTSISDIEKGLGCLLDTMCFTDALPAFRMKHWQVIVLLFVDALSVCRIPAITPYMGNGRMLLYKVLNGAQMSMEEYEIMKDLLIPLGWAPHLSMQSGA